MNPPAFAVDAALALRRRLLRAADAVLPPWAAVFDRTMGIVRTHALAALAELGVPAALGERALGLDELAVRVGADADTLRRLMRIAELDGIVRRDRRGRYALTRVGAILRPDAEGSLDPWVRYLTLGSTRAAYAELAGSVRTGEPSFRRAHGKTVWDHYAAHPEEEALFASAMRSISAFDGARAGGREPVARQRDGVRRRGRDGRAAGGDRRPAPRAARHRRRPQGASSRLRGPRASAWSSWSATCSRPSRSPRTSTS